MDKTMILEAMYETVMDSLEWAFTSEDYNYPSYVDGITTMTATLLDKIAEPIPAEW